MTGPAAAGTRGRAGTSARRVIAGGLFALAVGLGVGVLGPARASGQPSPEGQLRDVLSQTIETRGIDAAVAQYRALREQGFAGLRESESDLNRLGYRLLKKGDTDGAIKLFALNVETHPDSANAFDSLGEAHLAAGNERLAIESYEKALALDSNKKSAAYELYRLTGVRKRSLAPIVLFHITAGVLALLAGTAAMVLRKGSRRHALAGTVFAVSMLGMSGSGAFRALVGPEREPINVLMGTFTFYLVVTAWLAARRRAGGTALIDRLALLVAVALALGLFGVGMKEEGLAGVFFFFGGLALLASVGDLRMIRRGGVTGSARIVRHLWRMTTAMLIAVTSLFLGQPQVFPYAVRSSGVLALPGLLVIAFLIYWLIRVRFTGTHKRSASSRPTLVGGEAAMNA